MGTTGELERRIALLEEFAEDLRAVLRKTGPRPRQKELAVGSEKPVGSELIQLRNALVERFEKVTGKKYVFDGPKDGAAVKRLVSFGVSLDDVLTRWEECIEHKFKGGKSIALFVMRFNDFGKSTAVSKEPALVTKEDPYGS